MKTVLVPLAASNTLADILVAGFFEGSKLSKSLQSREAEFAKAANLALKNGRFDGKFGQIFSSYDADYDQAPEISLIGLGQSKKYRKVCCQKAVAKVIVLAKERKAKRVKVLLDTFAGGGVSLQDAAAISSEMSLLASYEFNKYKTKKDENGRPKELEVEVLYERKALHPKLEAEMNRSRIVSQGVLLARDLINEPANLMNPQRLAQAARELAAKKKIRCQILNEAELRRLKMGGILAVNQGSQTPAALILLEYGAGHKKNGTVCLVGKGVTFDTGGISIKPAKDMEKMKYDMSGAAAVIATLGVVSDLKLPVHVVGLAPAVENMVAANPQRPGDIIRMHNGKTVEVLNTDAEGRLILGDALSYSEKFKPDAIIDLATLTGMCAYTFGDKAIGLMGTNERLLNRVKKAGEETGERCWELPLWDDYAEQIKGHHSDLYNIGGPYGGTITAAMFLKEFVPGKTPWAHLDIAGTAWTDSNRFDCPKGATGVGVRLLANLLSHWK